MYFIEMQKQSCFCISSFATTLSKQVCSAQYQKTKEMSFDISLASLVLSGYQDSNLGPSGPKPDALTGLRYIPLLYCECKGKANFLICKLFTVFFDIFFESTSYKTVGIAHIDRLCEKYLSVLSIMIEKIVIFV